MINRKKNITSRRILLLGGTGAMGSHLKKILSEQMDEVYVTTRQHCTDGTHIHYLQGNAHDLNFLRKILKHNWDVIIDFMVYNTAEFREHIPILLDACQQYIFLSSCRVFSNADIYITESSPRLLDISTDTVYLSTDEYALTKARQENILRESVNNSYTIVRPYITYSEQRLQLGVYEKESWLYRALHGRSILFSHDIASHYTTLTYGLDVAYGIAGLVGNPMAIGEEFNIVTNETHTWVEILETYLEVLEKKLRYRPNVKYTEEALNLQLQRTKYQVQYCRLFDRRFDNRKILAAVPELHFKNTLQGISDCLESFLHAPKFLACPGLMDAWEDKVTGEHAAKQEFTTNSQWLKYLLGRYAPSKLIKYRIG